MSINAKTLCEQLMHADREDDVLAILQEVGLWDDETQWRYYGDDEMNYSTVGNQQAEPDQALMEKIVNCVDSMLMAAALEAGVDLKSDGEHAPRSTREAVARFFDGMDQAGSMGGLISEWDRKKLRDMADKVTVAATGQKSLPSFSIADAGEGQSPDALPDTILSLGKQNKLRIPFVQGKFNMGGTGVLSFCGEHGLQLVVSRRNPALLPAGASGRDTEWAVTVVRREKPSGGRRSSLYSYLAPVGADQNPRRGGVLSFGADTMPIFPEGNKAYARHESWGTLIKVYEYRLGSGMSSNILQRSGLLERVEILLPRLALPVRMHECRAYSGKAGSFDTTATGVRYRLQRNRAGNVRDGWPEGSALMVRDQEIHVEVFAFEDGRANSYRRNEGVIFEVNGQTHATLQKTFFERKGVGLGYLKDDLLIIVDCTNIDAAAFEELFMGSRDRMRKTSMRKELEDSLEAYLKDHQGLRELREKKRQEMLAKRLEDEKPLEDVLSDLLKTSPTMNQLFMLGQRVSRSTKSGSGGAGGDAPFKGKAYPTFFKFKDKKYGDTLSRVTAQGFRTRIDFETDVENAYLTRDIDPGRFTLAMLSNPSGGPSPEYHVNFHNGIATLNLRHSDHARTGESYTFRAELEDDTMTAPFVNEFTVEIGEPAKAGGGGGSRSKPKPKPKNGNAPAGIELPNIIPVREADWPKDWTSRTALRVVSAAAEDEQGNEVWDFHVNVDNLYLVNEISATRVDPRLVEQQFTLGCTLMALGVLHENKEFQTSRASSEDGSSDPYRESIIEIIGRVADAIAPVIIPMVNVLGGLAAGDVASAEGADAQTSVTDNSVVAN